MAEKLFAKGIRTFKPRQGAPDFVLGDLIITLDDLFAWSKENPDHVTNYEGKKQIKFNVTKSKDGGVSIAVNTYKKEEKGLSKDDLPF